MYHILDVRHPAPVRLGEARSTLFGMPADAFVRVAMPILGGVLSAGALIYSLRSQHHAASALALSGVLVSSLVTAGQVYALEQRVGGLP